MSDIRDESEKRGLGAPEHDGQGESASPEQAGSGAQGEEPEVEPIKLELPARLKVTGPKLKRRGKGPGMSSRQTRALIRQAAQKALRSLEEEHPEFLEEMKRAFAEAEQEGQHPRPTRLSYRPQKDREGLDPDGYENLEFYGDFLTQDELAEIARVLREQRKMRPIPEDPEQLEAEVRALEERYRRKDR